MWHGILQAALGVRLGITQAGISNWEHGHVDPSSRPSHALAALVGCARDELLIVTPPLLDMPRACPPPLAGEALGNLARRCRNAAQVSLHAPERTVRLAPVEIQAIEDGVSPSPCGERLLRWAEALGVEPAVLAERAQR